MKKILVLLIVLLLILGLILAWRYFMVGDSEGRAVDQMRRPQIDRQEEIDRRRAIQEMEKKKRESTDDRSRKEAMDRVMREAPPMPSAPPSAPSAPPEFEVKTPVPVAGVRGAEEKIDKAQ